MLLMAHSELQVLPHWSTGLLVSGHVLVKSSTQQQRAKMAVSPLLKVSSDLHCLGWWFPLSQGSFSESVDPFLSIEIYGSHSACISKTGAWGKGLGLPYLEKPPQQKDIQ